MNPAATSPLASLEGSLEGASFDCRAGTVDVSKAPQNACGMQPLPRAGCLASAKERAFGQLTSSTIMRHPLRMLPGRLRQLLRFLASLSTGATFRWYHTSAERGQQALPLHQSRPDGAIDGRTDGIHSLHLPRLGRGLRHPWSWMTAAPGR